MKKKVIAYLHSHWDREWYREFEVFRLRLIRVFDNVIDLLVNDRIPSFTLTDRSRRSWIISSSGRKMNRL